MSADLVLRLGSVPGDPVGNIQLRYVNLTNTPVVSVTWLDNGRAIADQYDCLITKTGSVYTCTVDCNVKTRGGT
jgi:hypothetical protein